ncbi:MAG: phage tail spike protein [Gordonibacter sp.]|uniref:phage tail spike protein n=1 Tax=Gordonibacter sp. TaxID=1968902 RepID=UPI002FCC3D13
MITVTYDGEVLHDPRTRDEQVIKGTVKLSLENSGSFDFAIAPTHPLYGRLVPMSAEHEVSVARDGSVVFRGRIVKDDTDMLKIVSVSAEGELAYLNDSRIRAYSTYDDADMAANAPANAYDLFCYFIEQHNAQVDASKCFFVGKNEGATYGDLRRRSTQLPTTGAEIKEKLLSVGGNLFVRHEGAARIIDWTIDGRGTASQVIEFGENLQDFSRERDAMDVVTAIIPKGKDADGKEFGIEALPDQGLDGCYKVGDRVQSADGVRLYGVVEETRTYEITTLDGLLRAAIEDLTESILPIESIDISAADLSLIDPSIRPINLGEWVQIRSKPHNFNAYMLCVECTIDVCDPSQTRYVFGASRRTLTNQNTKRQSDIRQAVDAVVEQVPGISVEAKAAAKEAGEAKLAASAAVVSTTDEYALSSSTASAPDKGWSKATPEWTASSYIWRRTVTSYGDGSAVTGAPAVMTGNSGSDGAPGKNGVDGKMLYGACNTASATSEKVTASTIAGFTLYDGASVSVKFTYANTASAPTLNVNGTGARQVRLNGTNDAYWMSSATVAFVYDGAFWQVCNTPLYGSTATIGSPAGGNIYIDDDSVDIRQGSTRLASIAAALVELGKNSVNAVIKLCGGKGTIEYSQTTPMGEKISGVNIYTEGSDGVSIYAKGPGGMRLVSNAGNLKKHGAISIGEQYVSIGVGDGVSEELGSGAYILMGSRAIHMRGYCPYEVGDILQTSDAKCATLAGVQARYPGTKWEQITNRFLYGSTSCGVTGGAASVTLRADHLPPGTLTNAWGLGIRDEAQVANGPFYYYYNYSAQNDVPIMPPYVTVYMWRRIS